MSRACDTQCDKALGRIEDVSWPIIEEEELISRDHSTVMSSGKEGLGQLLLFFSCEPSSTGDHLLTYSPTHLLTS